VTIEEVTRLTQRFADAVNSRDRDAWVSCFDPRFEGYSGLTASESDEAYRGLEGAGAWFDNLLEVYESVQATHEQTLVLGDQALLIVRVEYTGRASGLRLDAPLGLVAELRDGRYAYLHSHFVLAEALWEMGRRLA
jgi:ketosteroid isomerase-like protein